jgi:FAD/FMN-containing dehydrogenase
LAGGPKLGRGVLTVGDIASREELPSDIKSPLMISPNSKLRLPFYLPGFSLNKVSIKILNSVIHSVQSNTQPYVHYEKFLFPLDALHHWNRGYGKKGFIQYQFVIPLENGPHNIQSILKRINASDQSPFLNVLKKFGEGEPNSILSFPREGYTFAIDFPIKKGLRQLIETLDQMVLEYGGRVYLGKDAFLTPENFRLMYPLFQNWLEVKKKYDPLNKFNSNISRRIKLEN